MGDVVFLLVVIGFFGAAVAYVRGCSAVVGDAPSSDVEADGPVEAGAVAP